MISYTYGALEAMTAQLAALHGITKVCSVQHPQLQELIAGFKQDQKLLQRAAPFAWTKQTTEATLAASRGVPKDAVFNQWNLPGTAVFWHFEEALPFKTITEDVGVRALLFGIIDETPQRRITFPVGSRTDDVFGLLKGERPWPVVHRYMVSAWCDAPTHNKLPEFDPLIPSQTFTWIQGDTFEDMLTESLDKHRKLYGPGGMWHHRALQGQIIGEEAFMAATKGLAAFMLAGMSWINSKLLTTDAPPTGTIVRQLRKDYERKTNRQCDVKIVQLRRTERKHSDELADPNQPKREYSCQWQVDGHWRNQKVGPGRGETRLTWVSPYIKGPEDKPLRIPEKKVFVVSR